jgi:hypothetical protein
VLSYLLQSHAALERPVETPGRMFLSKPLIYSSPNFPSVAARSPQTGEVWAVDVKDYKDPFALGRHIAQDNRQVAESALEWQRWYYVYPSYRERQRSDYHARVLRAAGQLPTKVGILSEKQFKALVTGQ